jgi:hypothetical protein
MQSKSIALCRVCTHKSIVYVGTHRFGSAPLSQVRRAHYHLIPRRLSEINQWLRIGDEALTVWTQRGATFSEWLQKSLADKTVQSRFVFYFKNS